MGTATGMGRKRSEGIREWENEGKRVEGLFASGFQEVGHQLTVDAEAVNIALADVDVGEVDVGDLGAGEVDIIEARVGETDIAERGLSQIHVFDHGSGDVGLREDDFTSELGEVHGRQEGIFIAEARK